MDFELTDEQRLLRESIERLMADRYDFAARKRSSQEAGGCSAEMWRQYAELGLLALPFAESDGGLGGGAVETMIVMETFGCALALEPYLATIVLGGGFLRLGGSAALRTALVPQIAGGTLKLAFAHAERQARYDLADVAATARKDGAGFVLDGVKSLVLHGDGARQAGGVGTAFLRRAARPRRPCAVHGRCGRRWHGAPRLSDRRRLRAAEVTLTNVRVAPDDLIGEAGQRLLPLIERAVDGAMAALAAEAVGAMAAMHELTVPNIRKRASSLAYRSAWFPGAAASRRRHVGQRWSEARSMAPARLDDGAGRERTRVERRKAIAAAKVRDRAARAASSASRRDAAARRHRHFDHGG